MKRPPRFQAGKLFNDEVTAAKLNLLSDCLIERTPMPGKGTRLATTGAGFAYSADPGTSAARGPMPWKLSAGADNAIKVYPGAVNIAGGSYMPKIDGIELDASPQPELSANGYVRVFLRVVAAWSEGTAQHYVGGSAPENQAEYDIITGINDVLSVEVVASFSEPTDSAYAQAGGSNQSIQYFQIGTRTGTGSFFQSAYGPGYGTTATPGQVDYVTGELIPQFGYIALSGTGYEP